MCNIISHSEQMERISKVHFRRRSRKAGSIKYQVSAARSANSLHSETDRSQLLFTIHHDESILYDLIISSNLLVSNQETICISAAVPVHGLFHHSPIALHSFGIDA
jgi:hypothetical protein